MAPSTSNSQGPMRTGTGGRPGPRATRDYSGGQRFGFGSAPRPVAQAISTAKPSQPPNTAMPRRYHSGDITTLS